MDSTFTAIRFRSKEGKDFGKTLRKRVADYFATNDLPRTGDYRMWIKVAVMLMLYLGPYVLIISGVFAGNLLGFYGLWVAMGLGLVGCGLGIMHDANHGALSKHKWANKAVGMVMNLAGGYALCWKIQHNVLHHSFTNVEGYDDDINSGGLLRFSPHQKKRLVYRFQVFYAWILYGTTTFNWVTYSDFLQLVKYNKMGLVSTQGTTFSRELVMLIAQKLFYYTYMLVIPILLLDVAWYHIVLGWLSMHFVSGLLLALVFQSAHVVPTSEFPMPNDSNVIEQDSAMHQILTTANFAPNNRLLSWYFGGLNFQIEHHLFPGMCHIHHREISKIVKATAEEFGLPYNTKPTFISAIASHWRMLYSLSH